MNLASMELFSNNACINCIPPMLPFLFNTFLIAAVVFWIYKLVTYDWKQYDEDHKDSPF